MPLRLLTGSDSDLKLKMRALEEIAVLLLDHGAEIEALGLPSGLEEPLLEATDCIVRDYGCTVL